MRCRWLSLRGTYFQISHVLVAILLHWNFVQSKESPPLTHFMPYRRLWKLIKTVGLVVHFSKEAELRSWWDLIFYLKKNHLLTLYLICTLLLTSKPITKIGKLQKPEFCEMF